MIQIIGHLAATALRASRAADAARAVLDDMQKQTVVCRVIVCHAWNP